ncbi:MAG: SprT-like domain-containing protein [Alphaproteobacteria bacterium]
MNADATTRGRNALGTVGELAEAWGLYERFEAALQSAYADRRATLSPRAVREALDCVVEISQRAKTLAGAAYTEQRRIVLNAQLLRAGREPDRDSTFLHECAHILADLTHGKACRHGRPWREVMRLLGEPAEVGHRLEYLSRKAHAKISWVCVACGRKHYFVRKPRRRIEDCYCRKCGPDEGKLRHVRLDPVLVEMGEAGLD